MDPAIVEPENAKARRDDPVGEKFLEILLTDVAASMARRKLEPTQQASRDLIRSIFAAVEGLVWIYRQDIVSTAKELGSITGLEIAALAEESFSVTVQGRISRSARYIPLLSMFRLLSRIAANIDDKFAVDFGSEGWNELRKAVAVRNRITHPKKHTDLRIEEEEIAACQDGFYWLVEVAVRAMEAMNSALATHTQQISKLVKALKENDPAAWAAYRAAKASIDD